MKAKDVRSIEERFVELLAKAPRTKIDKQAFFRAQFKVNVPRGRYEGMWDRLVEKLEPGCAGEAVFEYVLSYAPRIVELIRDSTEGRDVQLRRRDPAIARLLFFKNGSPTALGLRLVDYVTEGREIPVEMAIPTPISRPHDAPAFEYDVALSFAGEERPYVQSVANRLSTKGVSVFYDEYEETRMWGKDLASFFEDVFRKRARYCVMFLSKSYVEKAWPAWEGRAAIARAAVEKEKEYVLPVRFDESEFPGLRPTVKYLDARRLSAEEVADRIQDKLSLRD